MKFTIHRGSHEIGGTCICISTETISILLDASLPLAANSQPLTEADLAADALIISHSHQDHCGLLDTIPSSMPVYIGKVAKALLNATRLFLGHPLLANDFRTIDAWLPFSVGDITITPCLMDHSATDAYGFIVEAEGKRLFYTGDFRGHGRKSVLFEKLLNKPPQNIGLMLMEGTMLQRDNSSFPDEKSVETEIANILRKQRNISFLISSSQNIDRIVSAYRACKSTGKTLVLDIYSAWVLEQVRQVSQGTPTIDWDSIGVVFDKRKSSVLFDPANRGMFGNFINQAVSNRIKGVELRTHPAKYLMLLKVSSASLIFKFACEEEPTTVIYSQWQGYLAPKPEEAIHTQVMRSIKDEVRPGVRYVYAHTSGHAPVEDLQRLVKAVKPRQLVPVHTEFPADYEFYFGNCLMVNDGTEYDLGSNNL